MSIRPFILEHKPSLYTIRILLGCLIVWTSLSYLGDDKKIWAIISVIVVSDPDFETVRTSAISRIVNTVTGCLTGLLCMYVAGINFYSLMAGITISVLLSTSFKQYPASWKLAPSTVAIVMIPAITEKENWNIAMQVAISRTLAILFGSLIALILGMIMTAIRKRLHEKHSVEALPIGEKHEVE